MKEVGLQKWILISERGSLTWVALPPPQIWCCLINDDGPPQFSARKFAVSG